MSTTPFTNEKADELIIALNDVTTVLQKCLKTVSIGEVSPEGHTSAAVPEGNAQLSSKGGRRQTRKGGKRFRRKSRRFR